MRHPNKSDTEWDELFCNPSDAQCWEQRGLAAKRIMWFGITMKTWCLLQGTGLFGFGSDISHHSVPVCQCLS